MKTVITPAKLKGEINAMPSKSHAHRLLIAQALARLQGNGNSNTCEIPSFSDDIAATKGCLDELTRECPLLDCGESGSTLRFLLPVAMAVTDEATFTGRGKLPSRPVSPLKEEMIQKGCCFSKDSDDIIFKVTGRLQPGDFTLPGNVSSQYITGLLFALPLLNENSTIRLTTPLESAGYVNMTLDVLEAFGINVEVCSDASGPVSFSIPGNQQYAEPDSPVVEGDWSNSAFWLVCGALGGDITCKGLNLRSAQPDKAILRLLDKAGALIEITELYGSLVSIRVKGSLLHGIDCNVSQMPDIVPPLSVLLTAADSQSSVSGIERLRIKESDRVASVSQMINSLGGQITSNESTMTIRGNSKLEGGTVNSFNDHRIAMAAAVASCLCDNTVTIDRSEAVNKSYPEFFRDFASLGGICNTEE